MKKIRLPKEFRRKWLDALKSGNYRQADGILVQKGVSKNQYCCLGVACRLVAIPVNEMLNSGMPGALSAEYKFKLPKAIINKKGENTDFAMDLANLNDNGKSFKEIAKVIRQKTVGA